jgi:hypothetical protein
MHWLGPFLVVEICDIGAVKLLKIDGILQPRWVNGARLNPYLSSS